MEKLFKLKNSLGFPKDTLCRYPSTCERKSLSYFINCRISKLLRFNHCILGTVILIIFFSSAYIFPQNTINVDTGNTIELLNGNQMAISGSYYDAGSFYTDNTSTVIFNGTSNSTITKVGGENFTNLIVNQSAGTLTLNNNVTVSGALAITSGSLITGSDTVILGGTATLTEASGSTVIGNLTTTRTLSQNVNNTFGGIGVEINASGVAPGSTTITRVTGSAQINNSNQSIKRYYDIVPAVDAGLNAAFIFHYDPATELNGNTENSLALFKSNDNGLTWTQMNGTVNTTAHDITLTGVESFSRWTAGSSSNFLPVELTSFSALTKNNSVELKWTTATENNNSGFEVQRSNDNNNFARIAFLKGYGTTVQVHNYYYSDKPDIPGVYYYRLKQIDLDGSFKYSKTVKVSIIQPLQFSLEQNYPNPFNPSTEIKYSIAQTGMVTLKVYNLLGQAVATIVNQEQKPGNYTVNFNASKLTSGLYVYRIQEGAFSLTKKMILLK